MVGTGPVAPGRIFISYRREETAYPAGWLYDRLSGRFGDAQVFKDVDSIEPGDDFVETITAAVGSCDVLLALIGDEWVSITDSTGRRRLDDVNDFVRLEIEAALSRGVRVIPILVEGAGMPRADELPPTLAGLVRRQALELSPSRFATDLAALLRVLDRTLAEGQAGPAEAPTEAPAEAVVERAPDPAPVAGPPSKPPPVAGPPPERPPPEPPPPERRRWGAMLASTRARIALAVVAVLAIVALALAFGGGHKPPSSGGDDSSSSEEDTTPPDDGSAGTVEGAWVPGTAIVVRLR